MKLCDYNAAMLADMLKKKEISAREIAGDVIKRIAEKEADINAFITILDEDKILAQADEADRRISSNADVGPLNGIPIAIKDNICTKDILTTCASKMLNNYIPPYNATAVELLSKGGAVFIGKTNMDEFDMGASSETSADGMTFNPANTEYLAGGSSSGSAASVAAWGEAWHACLADAERLAEGRQGRPRRHRHQARPSSPRPQSHRRSARAPAPPPAVRAASAS